MAKVKFLCGHCGKEIRSKRSMFCACGKQTHTDCFDAHHKEHEKVCALCKKLITKKQERKECKYCTMSFHSECYKQHCC